METRIARILSYLLHPVLMPMIGFLWAYAQPSLFSRSISLRAFLMIFAAVFIFTFLIPIVGSLLLIKTNRLKSIEMHQSSERSVPLLITGLSYMALLYIFRNTAVPGLYLYIIYAALIVLVTGMTMNVFWKVSLHTLAWGAASCVLFFIAINYATADLLTLTGVLILSGLAGTARLKLNAHSEAQIYTGYAAGAGIIILLNLLL